MIHLFGYSFHWLRVLDILIVAFLIYELYKLLKGTITFRIFWGIIIIYLFNFVVQSMDMPLLKGLLQSLINVGLLAIIIIFQPEIRKFLLMLGRNLPFGENNIWKKFITSSKIKNSEENEELVKHIIMAVGNLANTYTGALIILTNEKLESVSSGVEINGEVSARLLETIFKTNSPLHDGAVIIYQGKLLAAKVVLPVSENPNLPDRIGLRHRSGVGVTEESNALTVIVSEERGNVSYAKNGQLFMNVSLENLKSKLQEQLSEEI